MTTARARASVRVTRALHELTRFDEALDSYDQASRLVLDSPWGWNGKAYVLAAMGRYDDALASVKHAIALAPEDATFYDSQGQLFMLMDCVEDARPLFEHGAAFDVAFVTSWQNLAVVCRRLGREAEAEAAEKQVHAPRR